MFSRLLQRLLQGRSSAEQQARLQTKLAKSTLRWTVAVGIAAIVVNVAGVYAALTLDDGEVEAKLSPPSLTLSAEWRLDRIFPGLPGDTGGDPWLGYGFVSPANARPSLVDPPDSNCPSWQRWATDRGALDRQSILEITISNLSLREAIVDGVELVGEVHPLSGRWFDYTCAAGGADVDYVDLHARIGQSLRETEWTYFAEEGFGAAEPAGTGERIPRNLRKVVRAGEPLRLLLSVTTDDGTRAKWRPCIIFSLGGSAAPRRQCADRDGRPFITAAAPSGSEAFLWVQYSSQEWRPFNP